jgi:chromosome segregation ATPase
MTTNSDLTAKYEEERLRAHEQSQIVYLQGQIDELRRQIKDQTNKYNWALEQSRKTEGAVAQLQSLYEQHVEDVNRIVEGLRRDITTLRKEVAGALVKIEEGVKPMREMQAQIQQLADARKQDRDQVSGWFGRIEDSEQKLVVMQAQIKETDERQRQYTLQIDRLREADTVAVSETRRIADDLQVEKQSLRRQAVEAQQLVADVRNILDDHDSRLKRLDEIRKQIDLFSETLPSQYAELSSKIPEVISEIKRVERVSTERFLMNQERLEELRQQSDEKIDGLHQTDEQHLRQLTAWLERIDGWLREMEQRLGRVSGRLDVAQQSHLQRIIETEKRELATLTQLSAAFHDQLERVRAAQLEVRGEETHG